MKREEFIAFCERSGALLSVADGVKPVARNTVEERVKDCGDYRFVQAFADLFNCATPRLKVAETASMLTRRRVPLRRRAEAKIIGFPPIVSRFALSPLRSKRPTSKKPITNL